MKFSTILALAGIVSTVYACGPKSTGKNAKRHIPVATPIITPLREVDGSADEKRETLDHADINGIKTAGALSDKVSDSSLALALAVVGGVAVLVL